MTIDTNIERLRYRLAKSEEILGWALEMAKSTVPTVRLSNLIHEMRLQINERQQLLKMLDYETH